MNELKYCAAALCGLALLYVGLSSYTIVQPRHVCIWQQFGRVVTNKTSGPGIHFHSPLLSCVDMYVGMDVDVVQYESTTNDGIRYKGKVSITNYLKLENVVESYMIHGPNPDRENIYGQTEFLMQTR